MWIALFVAEKIGRVQHVDVQGVALDPFAAIDQPAQSAQLARRRHAARVLHGVDSAHLVRDRADAADARGDVGRFGELAPAQERLEEARRLEDLQLHVASPCPPLNLHVHRPSPSTRAR